MTRQNTGMKLRQHETQTLLSWRAGGQWGAADPGEHAESESLHSGKISFLLLCPCFRLEPDYLWFTISIWTWGSSSSSAHRPAAPRTICHLHYWYWMRGRRCDVISWLCFALCSFCLQLQHLQEHPETSGEKNRSIFFNLFHHKKNPN